VVVVVADTPNCGVVVEKPLVPVFGVEPNVVVEDDDPNPCCCWGAPLKGFADEIGAVENTGGVVVVEDEDPNPCCCC